MGRSIALVVALGAALAGDARADPDVRVDAGASGAWVGVSDRNGAGMVVEIKGMANDHLAIGGRVEVAMMFGGVIGNDELPLDFAMAACALAKAEWFVVPGTVRPFVGLGAGVYTIGSQQVDGGPTTAGLRTQTGRYLGVAPQLGIDVGRVRLAATYNAILGANLDVAQTVGPATATVSQNYLSLELSFRFAGGGGRSTAAPPSAPASAPLARR